MAKTDTPSWDGFLDDLLKSAPRRSACKVMEFIKSIPSPDHQEQVKAALAHPDVSAQRLTKALIERGFKFQDTPVRRHKEKSCACFRENKV